MGEEHSLPSALNAVEAVIFDLDGLVLDTESTYFKAWQRAAKDLGHALPDAFCLSLSGLHYREVETRLLGFCGSDFDLDAFRRSSGGFWYEYVGTHGIQIKKGFQSLCGFLREADIRFCLATNSSLVNALKCLDFAGLGNVFDCIVARDHVERGKPAPDVFLAAAERLAVSVGRCLVLEDSPIGVVAASAAGAMTVFVPSVLPADPYAAELCDLQCNDLDEVAVLLARAKALSMNFGGVQQESSAASSSCSFDEG